MNFINLITKTLKNILFFYNLIKSLGDIFPTFEGTLLNRNVGNRLPTYAGSYPRRRKTSVTPSLPALYSTCANVRYDLNTWMSKCACHFLCGATTHVVPRPPHCWGV